MHLHKSKIDFGLLLLLAFNAYAIYYYYQNPNALGALIVIFWLQSVFIGVFNVIGMLTFTNRVENSFTINDKAGNRSGCAALFFTFHYGLFHFAYMFFLISYIKDITPSQFTFIKLSFWAILAGSIIQYLQDKARNRTQPVNIGNMFVLPYARIVPMHLVILLPKFLSISPSIVFVVLKLFADLVMHIAYKNFVFKKSNQSL